MDLQMMEEDGVEEAEEEDVELDLADSTDRSVLVNGNEGEEQWGRIMELHQPKLNLLSL